MYENSVWRSFIPVENETNNHLEDIYAITQDKWSSPLFGLFWGDLEVIFFFTTRWGVENKASLKGHFPSKAFSYLEISLFLTSLDIILLMPPFYGLYDLLPSFIHLSIFFAFFSLK